jgi:hypothetical protein
MTMEPTLRRLGGGQAEEHAAGSSERTARDDALCSLAGSLGARPPALGVIFAQVWRQAAIPPRTI